jgi:hypothetical protein
MPIISLGDNATIADVTDKLNKPTEYVRRVLENMWDCKRQFGSSLVRIGVLGEGRAPNYRIEYSKEDTNWPSVFVVYYGLSHAKAEDLGESPSADLSTVLSGGSIKYNGPWPNRTLMRENWSSQTMSLDEVADVLGRLRQRKR